MSSSASRKAAKKREKAVIASASKDTAPQRQDDVSGVIVMTDADTSVTNAMATCIAARLHRIFIIDRTRGREAYEAEALIKMAAERGIKVIFVPCDGDNHKQMKKNVYSQLSKDNMFLLVPPDCHATGAQVRSLVKYTRDEWENYKRFAVAPTYVSHEGKSFNPLDALLLMFHVFWSIISILYRGRLYRGTYMETVVLEKKMESVTLPEARFGRGECSPFIYGGGGARSRPPIERTAVDHFLYTVNRESFDVRIWISLIAYMMIFVAPYTDLIRSGPHAAAKVIFTQPMFIFKHVIHFFLTLFYANKYFSSSARHNLIYVALAPFLLPLFVILIIYAKTVWRGYGGDMPTLRFPDVATVPLFTDYMKGIKDWENNNNSAIQPNPPPSSSSESEGEENVNTRSNTIGTVLDDDDDVQVEG